VEMIRYQTRRDDGISPLHDDRSFAGQTPEGCCWHSREAKKADRRKKRHSIENGRLET
jgi:hypothetical protein